MVTIIMRAWEMPTSDNLALGAADTPVDCWYLYFLRRILRFLSAKIDAKSSVVHFWCLS